MRSVILILSVFLMFSFQSEAAMKAVVSVVPVKYLADKITGSRFENMAVVEKGASPATYEPKPKQMVFVSESVLYFSVGVPFEQAWLKRLVSAGKNIKLVNLAESVQLYPISGEIIEDHDEHEEDGDHDHEEGERHHDHGGLDPHIWLSPANMKLMAKTMASEFSKADPAGKEVYEKNLASLLKEIDNTDAKIKENLKKVSRDAPFMVFHPSWGYFAREYNLHQVAIEVEGKEPKPAVLAHLIEEAKERGVRVVFVQPQFSTRSAETIATALGGMVVPIDPLEYEWSANLIHVSEIFSEVLKNK
jgi:zinc transport system substrate-binding protein